MTERLSSSCPQCGSVGEFYMFCTNCGFNFAASGALSDAAENPQQDQPAETSLAADATSAVEVSDVDTSSTVAQSDAPTPATPAQQEEVDSEHPAEADPADLSVAGNNADSLDPNSLNENPPENPAAAPQVGPLVPLPRDVGPETGPETDPETGPETGPETDSGLDSTGASVAGSQVAAAREAVTGAAVGASAVGAAVGTGMVGQIATASAQNLGASSGAAGSSDAKPRRSRVPWVIGAIAAALLAPVLAFALTGSADEEQLANANDTQQTQSADPSETPDATSRPSSTPSETKVIRTCWNGKKVSQLSECEQPTDRAGLRWIFPALGSDAEKCFDDTPVLIDTTAQVGGRVWALSIECEYELPGGEAEVYYSEVNSMKWARTWYDKYRFEDHPMIKRSVIDGPDGTPAWTQWAGPDEDEWEIVRLYLRSPWVVSIGAPNQEAAERLLREAAKMRPPSQILGVVKRS
jgi:hypothetical protein